MTKLTLSCVAALVAAFAFTAIASAASPYTIPNPAAFARGAKMTFQLDAGHTRDRVRSVGCAKSGVGRWSCAIVAASPTRGLETWQFSLSCPTDTVRNGCAYAIAPWTARV